jgi:hypothetical protein
MLDLVDRLAWPETPEEMHRMLALEKSVKDIGGFTYRSLEGFVVHRIVRGRGGVNNGSKSRGVSIADRDAA